MLTVTFCPSLDVAAAVPVVQPERKLRCGEPVLRAGGGGIVARLTLDKAIIPWRHARTILLKRDAHLSAHPVAAEIASILST